MLSAPAGTTLSGPALQYAAEALKVTEESRARSLLDLLAETNGQITEGVPAELLKRRQANLDAQQDIAEQLVGINLSDAKDKKKLRIWKKNSTNCRRNLIRSKTRFAPPARNTLL